MQKIIAVIILGVLGWGVFQALDATMKSAALQTALSDSIEIGRYGNSDEIGRDLIARVRNKGIELAESDIQVTVTPASEGGYAGGIVQNQGIRTSGKKVSIESVYRYQVFGFPLSKTVREERVFTQARLIERPQDPPAN